MGYACKDVEKTKKMAKTGRLKSENVKKKVLSIRVEDFKYKCICDYAGRTGWKDLYRIRKPAAEKDDGL